MWPRGATRLADAGQLPGLTRKGSVRRYAAAAEKMTVVDPTSAASTSSLKVPFQNVADAIVQKAKAIPPAMPPAVTFGEITVVGSCAFDLLSAELPSAPATAPATEACASAAAECAEATAGAASGA